MKTLKAVLAVVAALAATLAGLDVSGFIALMPPDLAKVLVIVPSAAAVVVHLIEGFRKNLPADPVAKDDEPPTGPLRCHSLAVILAVLLAFLASSCTIAVDPVTGRVGIATDPASVEMIVDRLNRRLAEKLEEVPPIAVPVAESAK
jgi:hypothetical protein